MGDVVIAEELFEEYEEKHEEEKKEEKEKILHDVRVKFPEPPRPEPPEEVLERLEEVRDESPLRYKPEVEMTPEELIEWEEILEEVKKVEEVLEEVKEKKEEVKEQKEKVEKAKNETETVIVEITERFPPKPRRPHGCSYACYTCEVRGGHADI